MMVWISLFVLKIMEYQKRDALRKSRIFLLDNVIFDELVDHVIVQDIFSDSMLEYIKVSLVSWYHIVWF